MSISDSDHERLDRAARRLVGSKLDDLTIESTSNALSLSESALTHCKAEDRYNVEAIAGLAIAFTHFASGSPKYAEDAADRAVAKHIGECAKMKEATAQTNVNTEGGNFVIEGKKTLLKNPLAFSLFASTCVWKFGDKFFGMVAGWFGIQGQG
jgi:hypothetical protein